MRVINLIDRFDNINFGVWNAAISTAEILKNKYDVSSEMWYPVNNYSKQVNIKQKTIGTQTNNIKKYITEENLNPENTVFVTHGCWQYPTRWGNQIKKLGFKWVYVPHAMLMPWCMEQKQLFKKTYNLLFERRWAKNADVVRAVGYAEYEQLKAVFKNVIHIPNGIELKNFQIKEWNKNKIIVLYLARIHKVKGIDFLVKGWIKSLLNNNTRFELILVGPDDGELSNIEKLIASTNNTNIKYIGPVYGQQKDELLKRSHFFIMPSLTEGFSSSVVEAMQQGCIPIISEGCNMSHLFEQGLAFKANPNVDEIRSALDKLAGINLIEMPELSERENLFASENYSLERIAQMQYELYCNLLLKNNLTL
jgi:glycosyltransferase involved in cell wall biosynthesis